jgi:hypothetical protein
MHAYDHEEVFGESKITEYTVVQENPMGPGKTQVRKLLLLHATLWIGTGREGN